MANLAVQILQSRPAHGRAPRASALLKSPGRRSGFSLLELFVAIAIIMVLMAILIPVVVSARRSQSAVQCISNLQKIGLGFQSYALDHQGRLPDPGLSDQSWEQMLLNYCAGSFKCPSDTEVYPAVESSYDWRDTGNPQTTLAGRSLTDSTRLDAVMAMEALPGWHVKDKINVVLMDGSARTVDASECFKDLAKPLRAGG